jgi:hypothetical protein
MTDVDDDEEVYARIRANVAAQRRLEAWAPPSAPKELIMSIESVHEQRRKIAEIAARLRSRAERWTEGPHGD